MQIERGGIVVWELGKIHICMGGICWTKEEDRLLKTCIQQHGTGEWQRIPLLAGLNRCPKSCRLRWVNYLRPDIKRGRFAEDEIDLIIRLHNLLGNRWSLIAGRLPGRTGNDVKNYWNCHLSKKIVNNSRKNNKEKQITKKVEAFKPQQRIKAPKLQLLQQEEGSSSTPLLLQPLKVDEQCYDQVLQKREESNKQAQNVDSGLGTVIDLPTDFGFQQVRVTNNESTSKRDLLLDDFIIHMEI